MTLEALKCFCAIVEARNFRAAAPDGDSAEMWRHHVG